MASQPKRETALTAAKAPPPTREPFGNLTPWAEPAWYNSLESPYYNDSHRRLRAAIRGYLDEHILPHSLQWEAIGEAPRDVALKWAQSGFAFGDVPMKYRPKGFETIAGIPFDDMDIFHLMVMTDEGARVEGGVMISLAGASVIGAPPIINYGTEEQKQKWLPGLFDWSVSHCLGITEPSGGSDVGNIRTSARKTQDGKHYIVNGHKKWITGSPWATHMTTAVRTGGKGIGGISLLVIPLKSKGISLRKIENSGQNAGGSSWVTLEDVMVPAENLIGQENRGFDIIMKNFNKERFVMAVSSIRKARTCMSTALQYAHDRETFGQPLIANQVIRHKFSELGRNIEAQWAFLEQIAYHIQQTSWQNPDVASRIALAKVSAGRVQEMAIREAQQVLGGAGYQKGGVGGAVEQQSRDFVMQKVGGGSEEIMLDLALRQELARSKKMGAKL